MTDRPIGVQPVKAGPIGSQAADNSLNRKAPPFPHSALDSTASSGRRRHIAWIGRTASPTYSASGPAHSPLPTMGG